MPELLIDFITSLDGYAAADGWPGWWGLEGPEYLAWLAEQPEANYTVLMGATTYRVMSGYAAEGEPGTDALAGLSKVVFSTTLSEPLSWANTQLVAQDPVEAVREMKDKASKSMRTIGSLTLCRSLLKAGLVDRFRVVVFPVITGSSGRERPDMHASADQHRRLVECAERRLCSPGVAPLPHPRRGSAGARRAPPSAHSLTAHGRVKRPAALGQSLAKCDFWMTPCTPVVRSTNWDTSKSAAADR
jgi:dihydrofolate reductase